MTGQSSPQVPNSTTHSPALKYYYGLKMTIPAPISGLGLEGVTKSLGNVMDRSLLKNDPIHEILQNQPQHAVM